MCKMHVKGIHCMLYLQQDHHDEYCGNTCKISQIKDTLQVYQMA